MTDESDRITVRHDDLLVEKRVRTDPPGTATVTLRLVSASRRPLAVRVVDAPPGDDRRELRVPSDDLAVDGETVRFEGVLDAGEIAAVRYEVSHPESDALAGGVSEPSVSVEPRAGTREGALYRSCAASTANDAAGPGADPAERPAADERPIASAVADADGADVFRLWLRFSSDASPDEREAVVAELETSLLAVEPVSGPSETFEATIATAHGPDAVVAAVEDVRFVDRASVEPVEAGEAPDRPARADGTEPDPPERFDRVRRRTEPLDPDQLLDDPEYLEFLDSFDELSGPDDEMSMSELLEYADSGSEEPRGTAPADGPAADGTAADGTGGDGTGSAGGTAADGTTADGPTADGTATDDEIAACDEDGTAVDDGGETAPADGTATDDEWLFDAASPGERDPSVPRGDHDTVAGALLAELERGAVSREQRSRLRDALGVGGAGSLDARVTYLQSRFHELASYVDALETFVDEYGSGERFLDELTTELAALRDDLEDVRRTQAAHERELEAVRERVAALDAERDDDLRALEESVETLERRHEAVREDVDVTLERWQRLSGLFEEE